MRLPSAPWPAAGVGPTAGARVPRDRVPDAPFRLAVDVLNACGCARGCAGGTRCHCFLAGRAALAATPRPRPRVAVRPFRGASAAAAAAGSDGADGMRLAVRCGSGFAGGGACVTGSMVPPAPPVPRVAVLPPTVPTAIVLALEFVLAAGLPLAAEASSAATARVAVWAVVRYTGEARAAPPPGKPPGAPPRAWECVSAALPLAARLARPCCCAACTGSASGSWACATASPTSCSGPSVCAGTGSAGWLAAFKPDSAVGLCGFAACMACVGATRAPTCHLRTCCRPPGPSLGPWTTPARALGCKKPCW